VDSHPIERPLSLDSLLVGGRLDCVLGLLESPRGRRLLRLRIRLELGQPGLAADEPTVLQSSALLSSDTLGCFSTTSISLVALRDPAE